MSTHNLVLGDYVIVSTTITTKSPVTVKSIYNYNPISVNTATVAANAALWTGEGPPHLVLGAAIGDEYLDTLTGNLYRLDEGT